MRRLLTIALFISFTALELCAQWSADAVKFTISLENTAQKRIQVLMDIPRQTAGIITLKMPVWTPGYYQRMDFAANLLNLQVKDAEGNTIPAEKTDANAWQLKLTRPGTLQVSYQVQTTRAFVATSYLDSARGYIVPGSVCLYLDSQLSRPAIVKIIPFEGWDKIATGLEPMAGRSREFIATNFDVLYDSPLLVGKLESLPSFDVYGVPHHFIGHRLGSFDRQSFMADLKKITTAASDLIGEIPFDHYTFIGIGPGQGGIEHLNSTTISFDGRGLENREGRLRMLNFIAHEYFHHYNAKRIRPLELGPFDYDRGNRTTQLWIAEGLTVYYEYLILRRAGISSEEELLQSLAGNIKAHEAREGKHFQSLVQASYDTWSDGPFGRTGEGAKKTISYYDKGPVVGLLLDFTIRQHSKNQRSLDDVMRTLYYRYYKEKGRGFTDAEFRQACESAAGRSLADFFEYIYTTRELDYDTILAYAGLRLDKENWQLLRLTTIDENQEAIWKNWSRDRQNP
jgi:predicted metalloprotease with PDZ domain